MEDNITIAGPPTVWAWPEKNTPQFKVVLSGLPDWIWWRAFKNIAWEGNHKGIHIVDPPSGN